MATTVFTHSIKYSWSGPGTSSLSGVVTRTGDADDSRIILVPAPTTDLPVTLSLDVSALKSVYMISTQDVTLETNATNHAGGNLIALTAGIPIVFQSDAGQSNPLTLDVTALYITNLGEVDAQVDLRFLSDSTP